MKNNIWGKVFAVCLSVCLISGCGNSQSHMGEAKTPSESIVQKGRNYQDVVNDFESKGFTNVKTEKLDDLVTGWLKSDGDVEYVSVGGDEDYSPDVWYPNDVEVIVTYHTFPNNDDKDKMELNEDGTEEHSSNETTIMVP